MTVPLRRPKLLLLHRRYLEGDRVGGEERVILLRDVLELEPSHLEGDRMRIRQDIFDVRKDVVLERQPFAVDVVLLVADAQGEAPSQLEPRGRSDVHRFFGAAGEAVMTESREERIALRRRGSDIGVDAVVAEHPVLSAGEPAVHRRSFGVALDSEDPVRVPEPQSQGVLGEIVLRRHELVPPVQRFVLGRGGRAGGKRIGEPAECTRPRAMRCSGRARGRGCFRRTGTTRGF